ncbi:hypothetical protein EMIHUDRAFT_425537 [Emiliania huxleyi CCMP1516]|uniref:Uncharacterized protein n=2 Tax=Emiliania huxleyi TaxID=2903 RepID=A0A0D3KXG0_EMIH1|nr:hypothetical protein EMIHUDRAFT_421474 [Emiliania huxleyi CCMP1516]XP_005792874.1 hypothetical protein EMIHUDRAFT_425537 [Emiliania huxleyi CCMP1516]EOD24702.1 hypothetical protein EMIHUDRAFT_421474 [Emiliania huxleyi CCMP1516]EOD40445.1 hypothetical protein EMIHUDRAFT_425537 [Emiliania huxleyi CCMP1516]|eukprot:XP_005777131.1 hypothetical protein EMIHUDRAFT_421474 [Emiliania huxleyi CCMP1516]
MSATKAVGAAAVAAIGGWILLRPKAVVAAKETHLSPQTSSKVMRRHSSGDHAFLPKQDYVDALKTAKKNHGVQQGHIQDSEGTRLPTTRGY